MEKLASVLLVDDDATNNFLNELLFKKLEITDRLLVAESGTEALQLLQQPDESNGPNLILLDVNMPGMNGIEFLENYVRLPDVQRHATVVIMLTTTMDARDLARLNDLPIAGLVSKPLTQEKLATILQLHFQRTLPN
ncbi:MULTISPECIES: response regulator [Hymenobacter]|uniref:Response regulator n=2 Tax=Hymenobacter TaxID=89966 RepID=A0ABS6X5Z9_9BACT|nr:MULTISPECIES: response regulator [Hymenobacter]MBO3271940.1 response regulator [Hymenobacter defluvii]MBW3130892.1 response regulator [Hymenobacter profundi]QNE40203.1 response regulator [Hymenobacter sp. NBH84]